MLHATPCYITMYAAVCVHLCKCCAIVVTQYINVIIYLFTLLHHQHHHILPLHFLQSLHMSSTVGVALTSLGLYQDSAWNHAIKDFKTCGLYKSSLRLHSDFTKIPLGIIQENNLGTFFVLLGLLGLFWDFYKASLIISPF